ncbi:MAG: amidohydrolase family protein [Bacteroidota bacterium]
MNRTVQLLLLAILVAACQSTDDPGREEKVSLPERLLLKDFRPESIYSVPVTEVTRAKYHVIDMHAHDYAGSAEGLDDWVGTMDEAGIEKTIVLSKAHGQEFDSILSVYSKYPERFEVWCGFDYSTLGDPGWPEEAIAELERCHRKGACGVGELGDKGKGLYYSKPPAWGMHPDDPGMDPLWEKCGELGMPVSLHVADPKWMYLSMDSTNDGLMNAYKWRLDNQPGIVDHRGMIDILERTLQKHPGTIFIACHLANCSYDLELVADLLDRHPNLYADISARYAEICAIPRAAKRFLVKYQDRIVYGTDMGRAGEMYRTTFRLLETDDEHIYDERFSYHWPLHALDLPGQVLEKIYRLNALKLASSRP